MSSKATQITVVFAAAVFLFFIGLFHEFISFKSVSFVALALFASVIISAPFRWSTRFFFVYLGFEGLAKIISNYHPIVHVGADILILTLLAKALFLSITHKLPKEDSLPPLTAIILLHVVWFFITVANPYSLSLYASLAGAKVYLSMLSLLFFGYYLTQENSKEAKITMGIWVAITLIHMIFSFRQAALGPNSVTEIHSGYAAALTKYAGRAFRPFGLTHLPGLPAVFVFLSTPFLLYFVFTTRSWFKKTIFALIVPLWVLLLFICQIRSALLKTIVGGAVFILLYHFLSFFTLSKSAFKKLALSSAVGVLVAFSLPVLISQAEDSLPDGLRAINRTMTLFDLDVISRARRGTGDRFLEYLEMVPFGAGLSRTGAAGGKFSELANAPDDPFGLIFFTDNFWIATLVDLGIPGMILMTLLIFSIAFRGFQYFLKIPNDDDRILHLALLAGLVASITGMYGSEAMLYNPEAAYFWFFSGCLLRIQFRAKCNLEAHHE